MSCRCYLWSVTSGSERLALSTPRTWLTWDEIAAVFVGPPDAEWEHDRALVDHALHDPWAHEA